MTSTAAGLQTASIETLTAAVHVLQVGNRQITLSVAKQLDRVQRHTMEPMGRINIDADVDYLIGKETTTGALVVATIKQPEHGPILISGLPRDITICLKHSSSAQYRRVLLMFQGEWVTFENSYSYCGDEFHRYALPDGGCDHWNPNGMDEEIAHQIRSELIRRRQQAEQRASDLALPLIVLAGLR